MNKYIKFYLIAFFTYSSCFASHDLSNNIITENMPSLIFQSNSFEGSFEFDYVDSSILGNSFSITEGRNFESKDDPEIFDLIAQDPFSYFVSTVLANSKETGSHSFPESVFTPSINTDKWNQLPVKVISSRQIFKDPNGNFRQYKIEGRENRNCTDTHCKYNPHSTAHYKFGTKKRYCDDNHDLGGLNGCSNLALMPFYPEYYVLRKFQGIPYSIIKSFQGLDVDDPERLLRTLTANPFKIFPSMDANLLKAFNKLYPEVQDKETFYYDTYTNRLFLFRFEENFSQINYFVQINFQKNILACLRPHLFTNPSSNSYNFLEDYVACMSRFQEYEYELPIQNIHSHYKIKEALDGILDHLPLENGSDRDLDYSDIYHNAYFILFFKAIMHANEADFNSSQQFLKFIQTLAFSIKDDEIKSYKLYFYNTRYRHQEWRPSYSYFRAIGGLMSDFLTEES